MPHSRREQGKPAYYVLRNFGFLRNSSYNIIVHTPTQREMLSAGIEEELRDVINPIRARFTHFTAKNGTVSNLNSLAVLKWQ